MPTGTSDLHRVLRATPEHIYRAFLVADAIASGSRRYGFTCKVHHMDPGSAAPLRCRSQFHDRQRPLLRRRVSGTRSLRALRYTDVRRPEPARGDAGHRELEAVSCGTESASRRKACLR